MNTDTPRDQRIRQTRRIFMLLDDWSIPHALQPQLLGLEANLRKRFFNRYRLGTPLPEDRDCYERIDLLLQIENALGKLFPHSRMSANLWVTTHNPRYGGGTPLDTMLNGGLEGIQRVEDSLSYKSCW